MKEPAVRPENPSESSFGFSASQKAMAFPRKKGRRQRPPQAVRDRDGEHLPACKVGDRLETPGETFVMVDQVPLEPGEVVAHRVLAENLVAPLPHLDDGRPRLPGQSRDVEQRHADGIRQRLVLVVGHLRKKREEVVIVDHHFMVIGAEPLRDAPGETEFVPGVPFDADRKGLHGTVEEFRHQRHVQRRVDAAAQEHAEGDIGHHAPGDRLAQKPPDLLHIFLFAERSTARAEIEGIPVSTDLASPLRVELQVAAGLEFPDPLEKGFRWGSVGEGQVMVERLTVQLPFEPRHREDRLDLGGEGEQIAPDVGEVQRLHPQRIPDEGQGPVDPVEEREGVHPPDATEAPFQPPLPDVVQEHLRVAVRTEVVPPRDDQFRAQLAVVEDLAVEDDGKRAVRRGHRLMPARGQVDDGKAPVAKADEKAVVAVEIETRVVRPAGNHRVPHLSEFGGRERPARPGGEHPDYAAHGEPPAVYVRADAGGRMRP